MTDRRILMMLLFVGLCFPLASEHGWGQGVLSVSITTPSANPQTIARDTWTSDSPPALVAEQTFAAAAFLDGQELEGSEVSWHWDFNDGTTATTNPVDHSFTQDRTYLVTVTATSQTYGKCSSACIVDVGRAGGATDGPAPEDPPAGYTITYSDPAAENTNQTGSVNLSYLAVAACGLGFQGHSAKGADYRWRVRVTGPAAALCCENTGTDDSYQFAACALPPPLCTGAAGAEIGAPIAPPFGALVCGFLGGFVFYAFPSQIDATGMGYAGYNDNGSYADGNPVIATMNAPGDIGSSLLEQILFGATGLAANTCQDHRNLYTSQGGYCGGMGPQTQEWYMATGCYASADAAPLPPTYGAAGLAYSNSKCQTAIKVNFLP